MAVSERAATRMAKPLPAALPRGPGKVIPLPRSLNSAKAMRELQRELKALGVPDHERSARALRPFVKGLAKWLPYVGAAITANELYELWKQFKDMPGASTMGSWVQIAACPGGTNQHNAYSLWPVTVAPGCGSPVLRLIGADPAALWSGQYHPGFTFPASGDNIPGVTHNAMFDSGSYPGVLWEERVLAKFSNALYPNGSVAPSQFLWPHPLTSPNVVRNVPTAPAEVPAPYVAPGNSPNPWEPLDNAVEQAPERLTVRRTFTPTAPRQGYRASPGTRTPPPRGTKEKKVLNRSAKLRIGLLKGLDAVSEWAEIVDAFYQALPSGLRKDYERSIGFHWARVKGKWKWLPPRNLERGMLDNAGQYGIDGADWKAKALWDHLDKVNVETAVENIIKNSIEDDVIGALQRARPKNSGRAFEEFDKSFGKELNKRLDDLVDFDKIW